MLLVDLEISLELLAVLKIVCVAYRQLQEHNIEFKQEVQEHVDSLYNVLHKRNAVAYIVILVPIDAFYKHLHVRLCNHYLFNLH